MMKSKTIVCAITAAALSLSSLSFAQGNGNNNSSNRGRAAEEQHRQFDQPGDAVNRNDRFDRPGGVISHPDARNDRNFSGARGPQFHRGGRLPQEYRGRQYVVNDWRAHRLQAPGRGQQWVQVGADYALVAIATGVIASLILNQ